MRIHVTLPLLAFAVPASAMDLAPVCSWTGSGDNQPAVADVDGDGVPEIVLVPSAGGPLVALSGRDCSLKWRIDALEGAWSDFIPWQPPTGARGPVAVGQLDGDPELEIAGVHAFADGHRLLVFDGYGRQESASAPLPAIVTEPSIADLDQDGSPEIVLGEDVFDPSGRALLAHAWRHDAQARVADVDRDGMLDIVAGGRALHADGTVIWDSGRDGHPSVADVDGDGIAEVVLSRTDGNAVAVLDAATGSLLAMTSDGERAPPASCTSLSGGPASLADLDGNGDAEILVLGGLGLLAYDFVRDAAGARDLAVAWRAPAMMTTDEGGITAFDLDGDGRPEVIVQDETGLRVLDGLTGSVRATHALPFTGYGVRPVVADADGDGDAEIVVACALQLDASSPARGVYVLHDPNARWAPSRPIDNQPSYHVTNACDDGTIPRRERAGRWPNVDRAQAGADSCAFVALRRARGERVTVRRPPEARLPARPSPR